MKNIIRFVILFIFFYLFPISAYPQENTRNPEEKRQTFAEIQNQARRFYNLDGEFKKPGWKQYKRWEWLAKIRLDSQGYFTPLLNWQRWLEKSSRFHKNPSADLADWKSAGPFHVGKIMNESSIQGLGRLNCIAFDPRDPNILWVGSPSGGLWKSTDGGKTWATNTDYLPNIGISDIVINPNNPDIMYIALGDFDAGHSLSLGIMKSVDGGETWDMTGLNPDISAMWRIRRIVLHPDNPEILYIASTQGIYKSYDGAQAWERKTSGYYSDLVVSPSDSTKWYAGRYGVGVYRSDDSGENWTRLTRGLPTTGYSRISVAVAPTDPRIIYASYAQDGNDYYTGFGFYGLYRSSDGGDSWSLQSNTPNVYGAITAEMTSNPYSLGHYAQVLLISPTDPDVVYTGSVNLWKSENGGITWNFLTNNRGFAGAAKVHVDDHDLVFFPGSTQTMFLCNDGGLYRSDDAGTTWRDLSEGLIIRQVYRLGLSPHHPDHFLLGSHDNGSEYFNGEWRNVMTGDGMECFIDPHDPDIIYVSAQNAAFVRSLDGGFTFQNISEGISGSGCWVTPLVMDPVNSSILYTGITRVLKSGSRGDDWRAISPVLSGENLSVIEVAPSNPFCILVSDGRLIFRTLDGGENWEQLNHTQTGEIVTDIEYHPRNPETVYLTMGGYGEWFGHEAWRFGDYSFGAEKILRSEDGGSTWRNITGDIPDMPVPCIAVDPNSSAVYIGTDLGVFYSADGMGNWQLFEKGLPNVVVTELEISTRTSEIWASTFGRGLWRSPLADEPIPAPVAPPLFFSGVKQEDKSLFQTRYFHILQWAGNPDHTAGSTGGYRLYRLEDGQRILLTEPDINTLEYRQIHQNPGAVSYQLTAVDQSGNESPPLSVTIH